MEIQCFPRTIETKRLTLRAYCKENAAELCELIKANQTQLIREFAHQAKLEILEKVTSFIAEKDEQRITAKTFCYGIWQRQANTLIGQIQVKNIVWDVPSAELGYFIGSSWRRHGYASESIRGILEAAFQRFAFQRIYVRILPCNPESHHLARKLGFREEGLHRRAYRCGFGELHDVYYLAMTIDDYQCVEWHTACAIDHRKSGLKAE